MGEPLFADSVTFNGVRYCNDNFMFTKFVNEVNNYIGLP